MRRIVTCVTLVLLGVTAVAPVAQAAPGDSLWSLRSTRAGDDFGRAVTTNAVGDFVAAFDADTAGVDPFIRLLSFTAVPAFPYSQDYGVGNGVPDSVAALAVAPDGSPFLAGWTLGASARQDYLLLRYTAAGSFSGQRTYDGPLQGSDAATAVAVDAAGAAYVTGSSQSRRASGDFDIVTVKYDAAGVKAWTKRFDAADRNDKAVAIATRGSYVYVAGRSQRPGRGDDVVVVKYDAVTGKAVWSRFYDDTLHRNDVPKDLVVTATGIYVAGAGRSGGGRQSDAMLLRFNFSGVLKWARFQGSTGMDVWTDMQAAPDGRIRVAGTLTRTTTAADVATASWRSDGTLAWRVTFSSNDVLDDVGVALTVDPVGSTFVACRCANATDTDIRVIGYDAAGASLWESDPFGYYAGQDDAPADIAVSGATVAVVGTSGTPANGKDYLVLAFEK